MASLHFHTITQIAELIESKQISPVDVTKEMLVRIGQLHVICVDASYQQSM